MNTNLNMNFHYNNHFSDYSSYTDKNTRDAGSSFTIPVDPDSKPSGAKPVNPDQEKKPGRKSSPEECETCKNRKYQDGSDETNVSFKSASHVSPEAAGAAVRAHENEHVQNAYRKASKAENAKVVNASVSIHTSICPECGKSYVSGGVTKTMIKYSDESNPYQQGQKTLDAHQFSGSNMDQRL